MTGHQLLTLDETYLKLLNNIKERISQTRIRAALAASQEMLQLYWQLGHAIIESQKTKRWGSKFLEQLSHDLKNAFPGTEGFSDRNLKFMRQFAETYPDPEIRKQTVSQLPWGHIVTLMQKVKDNTIREWYTQKALEHGWSRNILTIHIERQLYKRQAIGATKTSNFKARLPAPQSDLAENTLKDPYLFDFLTIAESAKEREIEQDLTKHITQFLLELGKGFAYVGRQYPLRIEDETYFIDLLFYHLELRSFVVVELKAGKFLPEHAGKLNFYLSAVDDLIKKPQDNPSIGILLCKTRDKALAEYALKGFHKPMGVSEYQLIESLPKELGKSLPSVKQLEAELSQVPSSTDEEPQVGDK
jgi:predicted nuclease of restriction endonuclease-like (RecB) superfamily